MSLKIFLLVLFSVVLSKAQDNNHICECDTEKDIKDNKDFWDFLNKISSADVSNEMKEIYSVSPGSLYQFDCSHCDGKLRKKRKIAEGAETQKAPAVPEETPAVPEETPEVPEEDFDEEVDREARAIRINDYRCAKDHVRIAHHCVPLEEIDW